MIPTKIGRYDVKSELGRGGMATVYRAHDPSFDREVAIKVLPKEFLHDPNFRDRFKREIKIIAALEHPAIVPVHDVGEEDGVPYFVMRYMPGGSLTNQINIGNFSLTDAARIIEKLASALAYAHKKGIVHRDLKPDNILFDGNGDPFISDFGVASFAAAGTTDITGQSAIGTPAYMSPEQAQGDKVDNRSDIYGLGVIIYQMLSGHQPYSADTPMGVAIKQITDPLPEILKVKPNLPKDADNVIKTAMAKNKEDRYPTVTDLAKALSKVAASESGTMAAADSGTASSISIFFQDKKVLIISAACALLIVLAGLFLFKNKPSGQPASVTEVPTVSENAQTTPTPATLDFFTEDFNGTLDNWDYFSVGGGLEHDRSSTIENGFLNFEINGENQRYYAYYNAKTYNNVRIDVRVENRSKFNSIVSIICRYDEEKGWYEFNINNGGLYKIVYAKWNADKKNTSYNMITNGGSNLIHAGKEVNEYSVTCKDRTLSLSINGTEVSTIIDNDFALEDGYIGVGIASENSVPIADRIDFISINEP